GRAPVIRARPAANRLAPPAAAKGGGSRPVRGSVGDAASVGTPAGRREVSAGPACSGGEDAGPGPAGTGGAIVAGTSGGPDGGRPGRGPSGCPPPGPGPPPESPGGGDPPAGRPPPGTSPQGPPWGRRRAAWPSSSPWSPPVGLP